MTNAIGSVTGNVSYVITADPNRDGIINQTDLHILLGNYDFTSNQPPMITPEIFMTHEDLEIMIPLSELAQDAEHDNIYFRVTNSSNGTATLSPDGRFVRFVPDIGFTGTAGFELTADDGYAAGTAEVMTMEVSGSPLLHIDFESRNPRLEAGQSTCLSVVGDFADQQDVPLPASYLVFASTNPLVASVNSYGQVTALSNGSSAITVFSHGILAATAVAVGLPNDQDQLLIYADGIDVVPQSVSIVPSGGEQQLFVTMTGDIDISAGADGTLYFIGNSAVASASADGLITAIAEGATEVTVINGAAEAVISVKVAPAIAAPGIVGSEGGVVEGASGAVISIAPGGVHEDTTIGITLHDPAALTWPVPYPFELIAGFDLNIGDDLLWVPAQLAIPVGAGVVDGTEVVFCQLTTIEDGLGNELSIWIEVDRGIVSDGMALTQTTLMQGVLESGSYMVASAPADEIGQVKFELSLMHPLSPLSGGFFVYFGASTGPPGSSAHPRGLSDMLYDVGLSLMGGSSILYGSYYNGLGYGYMHALAGFQTINMIELTPPEILPSITTTDVNINPDVVTEFTAIIDNSMVPADHPGSAPLITSVHFSFEDTGTGIQPTVTVDGERLLGNDLKLLFFEQGSDRAVYVEGADLSIDGDSISAALPQKVALGLCVIQVRKTQTRFINIDGQRREETYYVWSNKVSLNYSANYAFTATAWPGELVVMNAQTYDTVAQIPLEDSLISPSGDAFDVMITPDGSRAYVLLRNSLAVVDTMALQRIDAIWQTSHIDNIMLPEGANTDSFTIDPAGDYIYVSDVIQSVIYQISVNPADKGFYNTCVALFNLSLPVAGLRGLDVTSDGKRLYVAAPYSFVGWNGSSYDGKIVVVDVDQDADPDGLNIGLELGEINLGYHKKPKGINADSGDSYLITYTDMAGGFGLIVASENDIGKVEREILIDNEGMEIAILPGNKLGGAFAGHSTYAFVTGFKSELNRPDCPAGGNIVIIKDPFKAGAQVVGFTRPIPYGLPAGLAVSPDGRNLYVTYQRPDSIFVFSIEAILDEIAASTGKIVQHEGTPLIEFHPVNNLTNGAWQANPAIDVKADYRMDVPYVDYLGHSNTFQVYDANRAPISLAGMPWGIAVLQDVDTELKPVVDGVGDHLFFKNGDSFTFNLENDTAEGAGSGGNIVFLIEIEGPYKQFITFSDGTNEVAIDPSQEIVFAPQEQLKLTLTMKDIIAKNYDYDQLLGAVITIKAFAQRGAQDVLLEKSMCIIRFVSVTDPTGYTRYARFMKTLNDGPDNFVREKTVEYHLPLNMGTTLKKGTTQWDDTDMFILPDGPFVGEGSMVWKFDPTENGSKAMELRFLIDGTLRNTGPVLLVGTSVDRSVVSVDIDGFMSGLAAFLQNDDYFDEDKNGDNGEASNQFKSYFAGILPTDWFSTQEFMERIATEAVLLLQGVQKDFYRFENRAGVYSPTSPDGMAIQIVANNDDIPVEAQEVTSVWDMFTPPDPGDPAYTPTNSGPFGLAEEVDQYVGPLETCLKSVTLSPAAIAYGFAEYHNFWTTMGTAGPKKLNVWFSLFVHAETYANPAITFGAYCANTVSHELGHTFGLDEAYYAPKKGPDAGTTKDVPPKDIMRSGSPLDPDISFAWMNFQTLMIAAGIAPDEVDVVFRDTIKDSAKNFLLPEDKNGIIVNIRILETAQEPYASLVAGETLLFPDDHLDFGTVVADGIGGDSFSMEITLFNDGRAPLTVSSIELVGGGNGFSLADIPTEEFVLDIGQTIIFTLLFDPEQTGSLSDSLIVYSDAVDSPQLTIQLEGVGLTQFGRLNVDVAPQYASGQPNSNVGGLSLFALPGQAVDFVTISNTGGGPLSIWLVNVAEGAGQFEVSGLPAGFGSGNPLVLDSGESFSLDLTYSFSTIGLHRGEIQVVSDDPLNPLYSMFVMGTGVGNVSDVDYGNDYVAVESGGIVRRFISDSEGNFNVRLSPGAAYHLLIFDPESGLIGHGFGTVGVNGLLPVRQPLFAASSEPDSDGDGLPDDIEFAIGSSTDNPDTNFDGIDDFESVAAGINPVKPNFDVVVPPILIPMPATIASLQVQESPDPTPPSGPSTPQSPPEIPLPELPQPQHFEPEDVLIGIQNGDFSLSDPSGVDFGWNIYGGANVSNGLGILGEDSILMTRFSQTFMLTADVKELRFTIIGMDLGLGDKGPSDAFEVALLNANTQISLLGVSVGLTHTDSLLNIQYNGQASFSPDVTLPGAINSGDVLSSTGPIVVAVDLQSITEDIIVTLYFDFLGFAPFSSVVSIDDIMLITEALESPTAEAAGPYEGFLDVPLSFDAGGSSDADGVIVLYEWDWDSDGIYETSGMVPTAEYTWSLEYSGTVTLRVTDNDGLIGIDTAQVNIGQTINVPPVVDAGDDQSIDEGSTFSGSGSFSDGNVGDSWTATVDYGDGSGVQTLILIGTTFDLNHTYIDNGTYNITVSVTDSSDETGTDTFILTVVNVAPAVIAGDDQMANEGDTVNFAGTFTDPGVLDTHTYLWDFGDGAISSELHTSHVYEDNGVYTVTLTVTDNDGDSGADTLAVTVVNVAPIVEAGPDQAANEGDTVNFAGTFTDPGVLDTHTYLWDFGDGTSSVELDTSHAYADNGVYTVTLTVTDNDGDSGADTLAVTVVNVAPTIDAGSDQTANEGDTVSFSGSFTDPGVLDTHTYLWDFGDGATSSELDTSHIYADNGIYTVTLTVTDNDGDSGTDTLAVTVVNVAPIVEAGPDQTANEGDTVSFSGTFTDPGVLDTHTCLWDFGDGATSVELDTSHVYIDNGVYTVTLTVTDNDGDSGTDTLVVTVANVAPIVEAGPDQTANEGDTVSFFGSFTDPSVLDTHTYLWDFGDGETSGELDTSHAYADNGVYTVTLTVTDNDGDSGTDTLTVTVVNVAPTIDAGPDQTADEGDTVSFAGTFTDPGVLDTHTCLWDFGDGATSVELDTSHAYADNGVYTVTLTVTDNDGASGTDTVTVTISSTSGQVPEITQIFITENINENDIATLAGNFIDPDMLNTHTLVIDWGDGFGDIIALPVGDRSFSAEHWYLDDKPSGTEKDDYTVGIVITDLEDGSDTALARVTVNNLAPEIVAFSTDSGGCCGSAGKREVSIFAEFTDIGTLDSHSATIDWGDGTITTGQIDEAGGAGSVSASHIYTDGGIYEIKLTVTDDDTGSDVNIISQAFTGVRVVDGVLQIIGTCADDHVTINMTKSCKSSRLKVHANFLSHKGHGNNRGRGFEVFDASQINKIVVLVCDGNDKVTVAGNIDITVIIDGGSGSDKLKGGNGADVILGAEDNDSIRGGGGRDVLIGGDDRDRIIGNSGDDILIGGTTIFDIDDADFGIAKVAPEQSFDEPLMAILAEWNSPRDYTTRVNNLIDGSGSTDRLNGSFFLQKGLTVFDDEKQDCLTGSSGIDWLLLFDLDREDCFRACNMHDQYNDDIVFLCEYTNSLNCYSWNTHNSEDSEEDNRRLVLLCLTEKT